MRIAFRATVVAAVVAALGTLAACGRRSDATAPTTLPAAEQQALLDGLLGNTLSSLTLVSCQTPRTAASRRRSAPRAA